MQKSLRTPIFTRTGLLLHSGDYDATRPIQVLSPSGERVGTRLPDGQSALSSVLTTAHEPLYSWYEKMDL